MSIDGVMFIFIVPFGYGLDMNNQRQSLTEESIKRTLNVNLGYLFIYYIYSVEICIVFMFWTWCVLGREGASLFELCSAFYIAVGTYCCESNTGNVGQILFFTCC